MCTAYIGSITGRQSRKATEYLKRSNVLLGAGRKEKMVSKPVTNTPENIRILSLTGLLYMIYDIL